VLDNLSLSHSEGNLELGDNDLIEICNYMLHSVSDVLPAATVSRERL